MVQRSKATLTAIEMLGFGGLGINRMYAGHPIRGVFKLLLLITWIVTLVASILTLGKPFNLILWIVFALSALAWALWQAIDYWIVLISALSKNNSGVMGVTSWRNKSMSTAQNVAIFFLLLSALYFIVPIAVAEGSSSSAPVPHTAHKIYHSLR